MSDGVLYATGAFTLDRSETACVTGRRPQGIRGYWTHEDVRQALSHLLYRKVMRAYTLGYRTFISGMALGVDQDFAEQVVFVRRNIDREVRLIAAVPFSGQSHRWSYIQKKRYDALLNASNHMVVVSPGADYSPEKMHRRNEWMVDQSKLVIAAWDSAPHGGTYRAVEYARAQGCELWEVDTREVEVTK